MVQKNNNLCHKIQHGNNMMLQLDNTCNYGDDGYQRPLEQPMYGAVNYQSNCHQGSMYGNHGGLCGNYKSMEDEWSGAPSVPMGYGSPHSCYSDSVNTARCNGYSNCIRYGDKSVDDEDMRESDKHKREFMAKIKNGRT